MQKTKPKPRFPEGYQVDPAKLTAGRYGTKEMVELWGDEKTFEYSLGVQGLAALTLTRLYPDIVPRAEAVEIMEKANLIDVDPGRIRELEAKGGHDIIAINTALEEQVSREAGVHINKAKTSADTTQPARALQLRGSLEVIADSVENLRDILIEKSLEWIDKPHMDQSHGYDALPTVAGRPLAHYVEMLQSGLKFLRFVYDNSIMGKWGDATGNHNSAVTLGMDGMRLQESYCNSLEVGFMDAPAQVPGLEFEADIMYAIARIGATINNIAKYIAWGRSDDVNIFVNANPKRKKGSAAMPHKDAKNGNPIIEEQAVSLCNKLQGMMTTAMANCEMPYARALYASADSRIDLEDGFKFMDHSVRRFASIVYWIDLKEERSRERILRSQGVVTSPQVMAYLTDQRKVDNPMVRSEVHDLIGELARQALDK